MVLLVSDLAESLCRPPGAREDRKLWQGVDCSDLIRHSVSSLNSGKAGLEPKLLLARLVSLLLLVGRSLLRSRLKMRWSRGDTAERRNL